MMSTKAALALLMLPSAAGLRRNGGASTGTSGCLDLLVIGDFGKKGEKQEAVAEGLAKVASKVNPAGIIALGDNVYESGVWNQGQMVPYWKDIYLKHSSLRRPWYAVTGNHDWYINGRAMRDFSKNSLSEGFWVMPEFWHKKRWGDVEFFFIDSEVWKRAVPSMWPRVGEQKKWLESSLQNSTAAWKVVVGHHPMWSVGMHGGSGTMRRDVDPLMRKYGATIHLSGHDHSLQHIAHENVNYIVSGSGAKSARPLRSDDIPTPASLQAYSPDVGFASLQFCDSSSATFKLHDASGDAFFTTTLENNVPTQLVQAQEVGTARDEAICQGIELSGVDLRCSAHADGCTVQADIDSATVNCDTYCARQGLACSAAWFNAEEDCNFDQVSSCSARGDGLVRQICRCH